MNDPAEIYAANTVEIAPNLRALPILHGSFEFAALVRQLFLTAPPAALAIEIPESAGAALQRALPHADEIPVLTYEETSERPALHFILEPLEPIVEALRSAYETETPTHLVDFYQDRLIAWSGEAFPDSYALTALSPPELYRSYQKSLRARGPLQGSIGALDELREIGMAAELRNLARVYGDALTPARPLLFVCGMRHLEGVERLMTLGESEFDQERLRLASLDRDRVQEEEPLEALLNKSERIASRADREENAISISTLSRQSADTLAQPGYYNTVWIFARRSLRQAQRMNRILLQRRVYRDAVERYERESGELVPPQREKLFFRFARNWSIIERDLLPNAYRLIMAARAFGNDNFARLFYEVLNLLPPLSNPTFPEKRLTLDDMFKDSRMIRFRLRIKRERKKPPGGVTRGFKREKRPGEWREAWRGGGLCSYPPEDLVLEDFGKYLQKSATALISGAESRSLPFSSSLLDGIDYRETIRNLHLGRIYVRDTHIRGVEAGSVVVIFSEDEAEHDWRVVWWGEHSQESDMAFYASNPAERIVGPGICQSRYGGLMMTYPPGRLHDIWSDSYYEEFTRPADRLLAAAIEYNEKRAVVHLAERPPAARLHALAGRLGQKIIHIPLNALSPVKLARVRRFHVLDSRERRGEAGDYIW
jgi:hypothetical protein